jgi:hypothetical protein
MSQVVRLWPLIVEGMRIKLTLVTKLLAPITAPLPIDTPPRMVTWPPIQTSSPIVTFIARLGAPVPPLRSRQSKNTPKSQPNEVGRRWPRGSSKATAFETPTRGHNECEAGHAWSRRVMHGAVVVRSSCTQFLQLVLIHALSGSAKAGMSALQFWGLRQELKKAVEDWGDGKKERQRKKERKKKKNSHWPNWPNGQ